MNSRTTMAVLLRRGQWLLDEAAFEIGGGRYSTEQCQETSRALTALANALDAYSYTGSSHVPNEHTSEAHVGEQRVVENTAAARILAHAHGVTTPPAPAPAPAPTMHTEAVLTETVHAETASAAHYPGGDPC